MREKTFFSVTLVIYARIHAESIEFSDHMSRSRQGQMYFDFAKKQKNKKKTTLWVKKVFPNIAHSLRLGPESNLLHV